MLSPPEVLLPPGVIVVRLGLRKGGLFPGRPAVATPMHAPLGAPAGVKLGEHAELQLLPSPDNPNVRRWQVVGGMAPRHDEHGSRLLNEVFDKGGAVPVTRARAERPGLRSLELQGLVEFHPEPAHHAHELRAVLTQKGRQFVTRERAEEAKRARASQVGLFKGASRYVLLRKAGVRMRPHEVAALRQAKPGAAAPARPAAPGRPAASAPRVQLPSKHVAFRHPETGEERIGHVQTTGEKGITVVDHETGLQHRVHHGRYVEHPGPGKEGKPGKPPTGTAATPRPKLPAAPEPEGPDYEESHPGLNRYPPKGTTAEEGKPTDPWALRWKDSESGETVHAHEKAKLRAHARGRFDRLEGFAGQLEELRAAVQTHLRTGSASEHAVLAGFVRLIDKAHVNPDDAPKLLKRQVSVDGDTVHLDYPSSHGPVKQDVKDGELAALVAALLKTKGSTKLGTVKDHRASAHREVTREDLDDYVKAHAGDDEEHDAEDLRRYHASRMFAEEHDSLGERPKGEHVERRVRDASRAVATRMGHAGEEHVRSAAGDALDRHIDPTVVEAHRKGLMLSGKLRKGATPAPGLLTDEDHAFHAYLAKVREHDPLKFRGGMP